MRARVSPQRREDVRLEVLGDDVAGLEGGDEPVDLVLHVGLHQVLEVAHEGLGAAVELLVEALDDVLVEDAGPAPFAVRAAEGDLPVLGAGLLPVDRVDELGVAGPAQVQVLGRLGGRAGRVGDVAEVDDLDGLAGGQDDAADVSVVFGLAAHVLAPGRNLIGHPALGLYASLHPIQNWRVGAPCDPLGGIPQYIARMPSIGPLELAILLLIVLIIFGPKRLPGLGRQLGSGMREFKDSITGKDKDDDDRDEVETPAQRPTPAELHPTAAEPEVVTGEARREDQPASRTDS